MCFAWESHPSLGTWRCWASCRRRILAPTPWNCPTTTSPCRSWWGRWWFHVNMLTLWVCKKCEFGTFGLGLDVLGLWCDAFVWVSQECGRYEPQEAAALQAGMIQNALVSMCHADMLRYSKRQPDHIFTMLSIFTRILVFTFQGRWKLWIDGLAHATTQPILRAFGKSFSFVLFPLLSSFFLQAFVSRC